jgi:hypothetical protein
VLGADSPSEFLEGIETAADGVAMTTGTLENYALAGSVGNPALLPISGVLGTISARADATAAVATTGLVLTGDRSVNQAGNSWVVALGNLLPGHFLKRDESDIGGVAAAAAVSQTGQTAEDLQLEEPR